jgi:glycolate oxidase FAD binding subunit
MDASESPGSAPIAAAFEEAARIIVSAGQVRAADASDAIAGVLPQWVIAPGSEQELAKILKLGNEAGLAVIPRGGGTKLAWGNPPRRAEVVISTARLNAVLEHAWSDLTVTVQAGCTIKQLRETLAQHGQRLALDPLWPGRATVGGVVSANDSGALRLSFGSLRDLIIGVTLALPDGTLAKSGGKVVKNVAGYDLPKLVTGALGTLGVITQATFRLHPLPKDSRTISCLARDVGEAQRLLLAIQSSKLAHSAAQVRFVESVQPQVDVLFEGTAAGVAAQAQQLKAILAPNAAIDPGAAVWNARQELYSAGKDNEASCAVVKLSILPGQIAEAYQEIARIAAAHGVRFSTVIQATGIGTGYFEAAPQEIVIALRLLSTKLAAMGGSLTIAHRPAAMPSMDAWSEAGDALALMRAVKQQFDPKSTLNPGRFVGGI